MSLCNSEDMCGHSRPEAPALPWLLRVRGGDQLMVTELLCDYMLPRSLQESLEVLLGLCQFRVWRTQSHSLLDFPRWKRKSLLRGLSGPYQKIP